MRRGFIHIIFLFFFPIKVWAAPIPAISVNSNAFPKRGENIVLTLTIDNTGDQIGYFPYVRLILPSQLSNPTNEDSCGGVGIPRITTNAVSPAIDPYIGETITFGGGQKVVYIVPPVAQLTPGQPAIVCKIRLTAAAAASFSVTSVRSIFAYGNLVNGTARACGGTGDTICSGPSSAVINPAYAHLTTVATPQVSAGTGPQYPISVVTSVDVAAGQTLTSVTITDVLPDSFVINQVPGACATVVVVPAPTNCTYTPNPTVANGGTLTVTYASLAVDASITYTGYIRKFDDAAAPIINPATGAKTTSQNIVTLNSTQTGVISPPSPAVHNQRSAHVTKSVTLVSEAAGGKAGYSPGDTIEWTYTLAISDYFEFENVVIADVLQDGQTFVNNSLTLLISENISDSPISEADLEARGHLVINALAGGTTTIDLNLGNAMADPFFGLADDILQGAASFGGADRATKVTMRYRTLIDEVFTGAGGTIDSGDLISDTVVGVATNIVGQGAFNFGADLPLTTSATIVTVSSYAKTLTHKNGVAVGAPPYGVAAGDLIVFKLRVTVPDGGGESFRIEDYLPGPVFAPPGGCFAYAAVAPGVLADGQWTFGLNQLGLVPGDITPTCDAANDKVQFDLVDFDVASGTSDRVLEIYFASAATTDPSENNFEFANASYFSYQNSIGATVSTLIGAASFTSETPNVVMDFHNITATSDTGGVITSGNLTGVDAGSTVTFQTSMTNNGTGTAQDGVLTVSLPAGYEAPSNPTACTEGGGSDCQYTFLTNGQCGGIDTAAANQTTVLVSNIDINQGATCIITYTVRLALAAQPAQIITDEAQFVWDNGGLSFPMVYDGSTTTLKNPSLSLPSITAPATPKPGDDIDARITITAPDGTSNNFIVDIVDSSFVTFNDTSNSTLSMTLFSQVINASTYYCMINAATFTNNICFSNDPRDAANLSQVSGNLRINFGQMVNGYGDNLNQSVIFDVLDGIIDAGATTGGKTLRADYIWSNPNGAGNLSVSSANAALTVYTPKLTVTKCATPATTAAAPITLAETVSYNVIIKNTGANLTTAYDVANLVDTLASGMTYVPGSISAYYCTSGAAAKVCTNWNPAGAGCSVVAPVPAGNLTIPVINNLGDPDIAADAYFHVTFTADVNCESVSDTSGLDLAPSHPDNDGINDACVDPVLAYAATLGNIATGMAYSSQDGAGPNGVEGSYTAANSANVALDLDSDGDGIINALEGNIDSDGDGVPNYLDTDSDDNGIPDSVEAGNVSSPTDTDGDGLADFMDTDDDGDGISDSLEITNSGGTGVDTDGDTLVDFRDADSDNDGVSDLADSYLVNTDGAPDGNNAYDKDSDNDGIPDMIENLLGACDNGAGAGVANDGTLHADEIAVCSSSACIASPCDSDGNGGIEADEFVGGVLPDADGDGIPNMLDLDSDNDGLPDFYENLIGQITLAQISTLDANGNGFFEGTTIPGPIAGELRAIGDLIGNTNGVVDSTEALDSDGDGVPNFIDFDSDNDGVPDIIENARYLYDLNNNNAISYGPALEYNPIADPNLIGPGDLALIDTDGDGIFNYIDIDSDGDGIADWIEAYTSNIDTNANGSISSAEYAVAVTGIGNGDAFFTVAEYANTDGDGLPDIFDLDSDADTILDQHESDSIDTNPATVVTTWAALNNSDGAGPPDFRDTDSDDDGYTDAVEAGDAILATVPVDTDSDGIPDYRDTDSDNDGLLDIDEATAGTSRTNPDSDGDACKDGCEIYGNAYAGPGICIYIGKPWSVIGTILSPVTDPLDADTDDGGTSDCAEAADAGNPNPRAGNGGDDPYLSDDPDGDGLTNAQEIANGTDVNNADTDGDGLSDGAEVLIHLTNPLNVDTDGGGVPDGVEVGLGTNPLDPADDDTDGDGLTNFYENSVGLNPLLRDSNNDCIDDLEEIGPDLMSPRDTDGDGLIDALDFDNDGDGLNDCEEVSLGSDPNSKDVRVRGGGGCGRIDGPPSAGGADPRATIALFMLVLGVFLGLRWRQSRPLVKLSLVLGLVCGAWGARALDAQLFRPQAFDEGSFTLVGTTPVPLRKTYFGLTYDYTQNPLAFGLVGKSKTVDGIVSSLHTVHLQGARGLSDRWSLGVSASLHYLGEFEPAESSSSTTAISQGDLDLIAHYVLRSRGEGQFGLALMPNLRLPVGDSKNYVGEGRGAIGIKLLADRRLGDLGLLTVNFGYVHQAEQEVYSLKTGSRLVYGVGYAQAITQDHMLEGVSEIFAHSPIGNVKASKENSPAEWVVGARNYISNGTGRWDLGLARGLTEGYGAPEMRLFFTLTWGPGRKPQSAPPPQAVPEAIAKKLEVPIQIKVEQIYFDTGKENIKPQSYVVLDRLIETLNTYPQITKLRIEGHTDNMGDRERNLKLSEARARSVFDFLVKGGIAPDRLEVQGFGPDQPVADNTTPEGQRTNRRVDFKIVESSGELNF